MRAIDRRRLVSQWHDSKRLVLLVDINPHLAALVSVS